MISKYKTSTKKEKVKKINSRQKGHDFERWFANFLKSSGLDPNAKRHLEYQGQESYGKDIDTELPFIFQLKVGQKPDIWKAVKEIKPSSANICAPVVVAKRNVPSSHEKPTILVAMKLSDWIDLVKRADAIEKNAKLVGCLI